MGIRPSHACTASRAAVGSPAPPETSRGQVPGTSTTSQLRAYVAVAAIDSPAASDASQQRGRRSRARDHADDLTVRDLVARADAELGDDSVRVRDDLVLHLHRLDDTQEIARPARTLRLRPRPRAPSPASGSSRRRSRLPRCPCPAPRGAARARSKGLGARGFARRAASRRSRPRRRGRGCSPAAGRVRPSATLDSFSDETTARAPARAGPAHRIRPRLDMSYPRRRRPSRAGRGGTRAASSAPR